MTNYARTSKCSFVSKFAAVFVVFSNDRWPHQNFPAFVPHKTVAPGSAWPFFCTASRGIHKWNHHGFCEDQTVRLMFFKTKSSISCNTSRLTIFLGSKPSPKQKTLGQRSTFGTSRCPSLAASSCCPIFIMVAMGLDDLSISWLKWKQQLVVLMKNWVCLGIELLKKKLMCWQVLTILIMSLMIHGTPFKLTYVHYPKFMIWWLVISFFAPRTLPST